MNQRIVVITAAILFSICIVNAPAQEHNSTESNARNTITIEYIAHACFRITTPSGKQLLIDPFASRIWIGYDYPDGIDVDAVLITHPHYDHDGGVSRDRTPPWPETMTVLRKPGRFEISDVEIHGVAGKHADPYGREFGQTNTIWLLEVAGLRIVHIGDNGPLSDAAAAQLGTVDILMMPIDSQYHILKEHEIQSILTQLNPSILVPMHYRLADLEPEQNEPDDLGDIDGWLTSKDNVRRLATHQATISRADLPGSREILVFKHWPTLERPRDRH